MRRNFGLQVMECGSIERNGSFHPSCHEHLKVEPPSLLSVRPFSNRNNVTSPENIENTAHLEP